MTAPGGSLRFADILTTASAVANYLNEPTVTAGHLLDGIAILQETKTMEDLGRAVSPLIRRQQWAGGGVTPGVRALVQRWFTAVGDVNAEIGGEDLVRLGDELRALDAEEQHP